MKISWTPLLAALASAATTQDRFIVQHEQIHSNTYPNVADGAKVARTLVNRESLMNANTIQKFGDSEYPTSSMEYYADCDLDGNPYWLVIDIGSPARNIAQGSLYSFTIRAGDHPAAESVDAEYPGGITSLPAGSPRLTLKGELQEFVSSSPEEIAKLESCFVKRHPDSKWWLPLNKFSPHKAHWVKIIVSDVYMIGGFGDRAYIGPVSGEEYHAASII